MTVFKSSASPTDVKTVSRATASLPQTTQSALFTVSGGRVLVLSIVGEVTTVIQTQANNADLYSNPTVGADVALCAVNDITADAVGTFYNITGTLADALVATVSGAAIGQANPVLVSAGTIDLKCAASNTGAIKWTISYVPDELGAVITVA